MFGICTNPYTELITKDLKATMKYKSYVPNIVMKYQVMLVNWPEGVPFQAPSEMSSVRSVYMLLEALGSGKCQWQWASKKDVKKLVDETTSGGCPLKEKWKQHSDRGKTHNHQQGGEPSRKRHCIFNDRVASSDDDANYCSISTKCSVMCNACH